MLHVQKVHSFHIEAVLPKIRGEPFKQLALRIRNERGLAALGAAHEERDDEPAGLAAARCADAEQIVVVPGNHPVRGIERVSIRIIRMLFDFAEDHALRPARRRQLQKLAHLFLRQKSGCAMRTVRENVKAAWVMRVFVAREPYITFFRNETDNQHDHQRRYDSKACEYCTPVLERVQHPDAFDLILTSVEGRCNSEPQGIEKHPIKIPADDHGWHARRQFGFISFVPAFESCVYFVLQLFKEL